MNCININICIQANQKDDKSMNTGRFQKKNDPGDSKLDGNGVGSRLVFVIWMHHDDRISEQ